jgi:hypothetical protein
MNNTDGSRSYLQIAPSNQTARISYKSGSPVINFVIGEQNRFIDGYSVRFTGNIAVYKAPNGEFGDIPLPTDDLNISSKIGIYGMIDQVVITSQKYKSVIEHCKHFGRYLSSYIPARSSPSEALTNYSNNVGILNNVKGQQLSVVNNLNGSVATDRVYRGTSFSIDLPTGFLNSGTPIPLSGNGGGTGGLEIAVHLAPDSQFLNGSWTNAFYQLTDVNLHCEVINPSVDQLSQMMAKTSNSMEYNAITGYYQTIQSSNAILNLRLGLSRVLGFFVNFIPSENLNNLTYDGFQCSPLINDKTTGAIAPIQQLIFLKGGNRLPLMYNLDANVRNNANSEIADPQIFRNYMNAFGNFDRIMRTQQSPITNNRISQVSQTDYADSGQMFGIGIAFDKISSEGIDLRNENLSVQMETGLTSGLAHSAFMFVRAKQTLLFTQNGLQVIN